MICNSPVLVTDFVFIHGPVSIRPGLTSYKRSSWGFVPRFFSIRSCQRRIGHRCARAGGAGADQRACSCCAPAVLRGSCLSSRSARASRCFGFSISRSFSSCAMTLRCCASCSAKIARALALDGRRVGLRGKNLAHQALAVSLDLAARHHSGSLRNPAPSHASARAASRSSFR